MFVFPYQVLSAVRVEREWVVAQKVYENKVVLFCGTTGTFGIVKSVLSKSVYNQTPPEL